MNDSGMTFRFRRNAKIGEAAAEEDDEFLFSSFLDVGDYGELRNTRSPQRIIVGRTGSGKTALLRYLSHTEEHVVEVEPEHLALNFISNNEVIQFFEEMGVKLDLFYSLLWKHVLAVELLKSRYSLHTEEKTKTWIAGILDVFKKKDQSKEKALGYLSQWGDRFWIETENRIKELTTKMAGELTANAGVTSGMISAGAKATASMSEEARQEIIHRGQAVVNKVQLKELSDVLRFLHEDVFTDTQRPYFVTIDKLDENWVDDALRYRLIRALIDTVKSFQKVQNVKVVVALRQDLLRKVFTETADGGFQEEKYEALFLRLRWSKRQIENLVDKRLGVLVRKQYSNRPLGLKELFPEKVGRSEFLDFFIQRTALRPRDAILFVNDCIVRSEEYGKVRVQTVFEAERAYSELRKTSLIYEWKRIYPSLGRCLALLERQPAEFKVSSIDSSLLDNLIGELAETLGTSDSAILACQQYMRLISGSRHAVAADIFRMFFDVGAIGLRLEGGSGPIWSIDGNMPTSGAIKPSSKAMIHPMFYQALHTSFP